MKPALMLALGMVVATIGIGFGSPSPLIVELPAAAAAEQTHWITTSSGVRHNKSCRWYKNSKGRPCGPTEGRACKKCGG